MSILKTLQVQITKSEKKFNLIVLHYMKKFPHFLPPKITLLYGFNH